MLGHRQLRPEDYLAILRRRKWLILVPLFLGPVAGYLVSRVLPSRYASQTVVLIDQPKVPDSFVKPVVSDEMNQRLMTMQEQILSRSRLQPIIERYGLVKDQNDSAAMDDVVAAMRKDIVITPTRPLEGTESRGVLGFTISYTGQDAHQAQTICNEISSMFIDDNLQHRAQRAEDTTQFLEKQLEDAKHALDEQDAKLAEFKRHYIDQLPDQVQTNMSLLQSTNTQLEAATQAISRAQQDKAFTQSLLSQQLAAWKATISDTSPQTLETQLANMQAQLVALEARYTPDHPDVIKLRNDIEQLRVKLDEANAAAKAQANSGDNHAGVAEPPQIQQLRAQLHQYDQIIQDKNKEQERFQDQIRTYQARIHMSPLVEQEYKEITRDYTNAQAFYNDLLTKKSQSEMATNLERQQEGEQFRVLDPANLPDRPIFPDRRLFAAAGTGLGMVFGVCLTLVFEMRDKALRTEEDIELFLQLPTLALVPNVGRSNGKRHGTNSHARGNEALVLPRRQA